MDHKRRSTIAGSFSGPVRTLRPPGTGKGTAAWYSFCSYVERRVPGGTADQPSDAATSLTYSFDVAHWMNCFPSLTCFEEAGIPKAQDQSHCAPFGTLPMGAGAKPRLLATFDSLGFAR